jgi:hypothetical protein
MKVSEGDYVIIGTQGEMYPIKPQIFKDCYETQDQNRQGKFNIGFKEVKESIDLNLTLNSCSCNPDDLKVVTTHTSAAGVFNYKGFIITACNDTFGDVYEVIDAPTKELYILVENNVCQSLLELLIIIDSHL